MLTWTKRSAIRIKVLRDSQSVMITVQSIPVRCNERNSFGCIRDCYSPKVFAPIELKSDKQTKKQTPWSQSASELYRQSNRRLLAKLVPTFEDRGVPRCQRDGSLRRYSRISRPKPLLFLPSSSSIVLTRLSGPRSTSQKI
jgi:hypothetical protein